MNHVNVCVGKYGLKMKWTEFQSTHVTTSGTSLFTTHPDNCWDLTINFRDESRHVLMFNRCNNAGGCAIISC